MPFLMFQESETHEFFIKTVIDCHDDKSVRHFKENIFNDFRRLYMYCITNHGKNHANDVCTRTLSELSKYLKDSGMIEDLPT